MAYPSGGMNWNKYLLMIFLATTFKTFYCYNIEVNEQKVGITLGKENSKFGYTVAIVRKPGWVERTGPFDFDEKELLVGAPNETFNNINGHGQVFECSNPRDRAIQCTSLNLTEISQLCEKRLSTGTTSKCSTDSRLGATLEVNRDFPKIMDSSDESIPMITVCAPGWKNVFPETSVNNYQNYMTGMCLKMRDNFKPIDCSLYDRKYCWPFWPYRDTTSYKGRPVFTYAQAGMSAAFTVDGLSEVIGAPGADDWRGSYRAFQKEWLERLKFEYTTNTMYFGYALTTGTFGGKKDMIVSGMPNWNDPNGAFGHFGKVQLFYENAKHSNIEFGIPKQACPGQISLDLRSIIDEQQTGSKFGAALKAVDITGDGYDELFVSAPLYTGDNPEEGRVFVYSSSEKTDSVCGPIGVLSGGANVDSLKGKTVFARFGSSIASAGDLDKDGYNDVAISAPFEDEGTGAVYIYQGIGQCGCKMEDTFSQRIAGRNLNTGIRSFGWSLYGNEDIDDNNFPDLAVGAPESDRAFIFRARPIVMVDIEIRMSPNPIPLNGSLLSCSIDKVSLCFNVNVLFQFRSVGDTSGNTDDITLMWTLDSDTVHKSKEGWSRVEFRMNGKGTYTENITLSGNDKTPQVKNYTIDVKRYRNKPEPKDAWTKVRMEGRYELIPTSEDNFVVLDPILHQDAKDLIVGNVEFDKKCDSIITCTSDLKLAVEMFLLKDGVSPIKVEEDTTLYVDSVNVLQVTADVMNLLNSSYRANFSGDVTALMKRDASPNNGLVGASCKYESPHQISTVIYCTADSKLDRNENMKIKMYFDVSRQRLIPGMDLNKMMEYVNINLTADQANKDVDTNNNLFERKLSVKLKYEVLIQTDKETSDQVRYKADVKSERKIKLVHRYYIINEGPSFLPRTYVNITIPLSKGDIDFAVIKDMPTKCSTRGKEAIVQTTTTATKATTIYPTQPETDVERRRRDAEQNPKASKSTGDKPQQTVKDTNITCEEYTCAVIECEVVNLEHNEQEIIDITIDVYEKELAKEKEVREVRYATNATVTDPYIWYGGKVVPWEKTVYAEKWTTFVVEPTSVVSEVNIWIIIGSVLGALALLIIVIIILWKCGFFARKKHSQVQQWKRASLYNRKSMRMSSGDKQPYSAMEDKELNEG